MLSSGSGSRGGSIDPVWPGTWADRAVGSGVVTVVVPKLSVRRRAIASAGILAAGLVARPLRAGSGRDAPLPGAGRLSTSRWDHGPAGLSSVDESVEPGGTITREASGGDNRRPRRA